MHMVDSPSFARPIMQCFEDQTCSSYFISIEELRNGVELRQALAPFLCLLLGLAKTSRSDFSAVLIINPGLATSVTQSASVVFKQFPC